MPPTRRKPTTTQVDPLADLRESPVDPRSPQAVTHAEPEPVKPEARIIAAWHRDPVAVGFLHCGGQCGCRYLARLAVQE